MTEVLQSTPKARLLVVDDADDIRLAISEILIDQGYVVDVAASGAAALQALERATYDLMLLDLKMPGIDGVEVMKRVRASGRDLPVVIITAHPTVESAIIAVRTGVRDYLPKPFGADELLAVVERIIAARAREQRRKLLLDTITETVAQLQSSGVTSSPPSTPPPGRWTDAAANPTGTRAPLKAGQLCLDREKRRVFLCDKEDTPEELTEGEAAILSQLMARPDGVFSCRDLAIEALDYEALDEYEAQSIVRPYIFRLRQKVELDPRHPQFIRTVRGRGYYLSTD